MFAFFAGESGPLAGKSADSALEWLEMGRNKSLLREWKYVDGSVSIWYGSLDEKYKWRALDVKGLFQTLKGLFKNKVKLENEISITEVSNNRGSIPKYAEIMKQLEKLHINPNGLSAIHIETVSVVVRITHDEFVKAAYAPNNAENEYRKVYDKIAAQLNIKSDGKYHVEDRTGIIRRDLWMKPRDE